MGLPQHLPLDLMQTRWGSEINPVLGIPFVKGLAIEDIVLVANTPKTIPIEIGRKQQGWWITNINAFALVKINNPFNAVNMTLEASADVTISIWVY